MIVNPQEFRRTALHYIKHGEYQSAPIKSKEYYEFWREEKRRCVEGYSVGGHWIPGKLYFYLNFFPIWRKPTADEIKYKKVSVIQKKVFSFPEFWKIQHDWFVEKDKAFKRPYGEGNHMIAFKTRACGWSYMDAAEGVYNYNFIAGGKSFYLAMLDAYLLGKDGVLLKAWDGLDHLNQHTQGYWSKNRQRKDTMMFKESGYYDGSGNYKGYKSVIAGIIVDHPRKARGARGIKVTFEEAGSFKNFGLCLEAVRPLVEEPPDLFGQISVFGTGGEEGEYIEEAEEVFNEPSKYNFAEFPNIFEPDYEFDTIGYFVPCTFATQAYMDDKGAPMIDEATAFWEGEYAKNEGNLKTLDRFKAEHPMYMSDVFQRAMTSIFDRELAKRQMNRIKNSTAIKAMVKRGEMYRNSKGELDFRPIKGMREVPFPAREGDSLKGCITVVHRPDETNYRGRYVLLHDPWYKDEEDVYSKSIGSTYVLDIEKELIVAWYHGRVKKDVYLRKMFELARFYDATIQAEIAGGGEDIIRYARQHRMLHMLEFEPEMWHNRELASAKRSRSYLMNMTADRKVTGLTYLADWISMPRGLTANEEPVYNINRIYDENLLAEIIKFKDKGNFDRVSTMIIAMYMLKERHALVYKRKLEDKNKNRDSFFNRPLFTDNMPNELVKL
jgi:hypothetical protein